MCSDGRITLERVVDKVLPKRQGRTGIVWYSSPECNQYCTYCPIPAKFKAGGAPLCTKEEIEQIKSIVDKQITGEILYMIVHGPGEPLVQAEAINEVVTYLKDTGKLTNPPIMYTNGIAIIDDRVFDICKNMYMRYHLHFVGIDNEYAKKCIHNSLTRDQKLEVARRFRELPFRSFKIPITMDNIFVLSTIIDEITSLCPVDEIEFAIDDRMGIDIQEEHIEKFVEEMVKVATIFKERNIRPKMVFSCDSHNRLEICYPATYVERRGSILCSYEESNNYPKSVVKFRQKLLRDYAQNYCYKCELNCACSPCLQFFDTTSKWTVDEKGMPRVTKLGTFNKCNLYLAIHLAFKKVLGVGLVY